jgi:two-component system OmpR family response regulator
MTGSAAEAMRSFASPEPNVLLIDVQLPDADGRDLCQALRAAAVDVPVLFLSGSGTLAERLSSFHAGGDDYVTKPFSTAELIARVSALGRRRTHHRPPPADTDLAFDPTALAVSVQGRSVDLTPTEFRLLAALSAHRGEILRRAQLVEVAWPSGSIVHDNTLDVFVVRLRRKLREIGAREVIEAARGVGYALH